MNAIWFAVLAFLAGTAVGCFYFAGLWFTVRRLPSARSPGLLAFGSFAARTVVAVFCFYLIATRGHWAGVIASVLGFALARWILVARLQPRETWSK